MLRVYLFFIDPSHNVSNKTIPNSLQLCAIVLYKVTSECKQHTSESHSPFFCFLELNPVPVA